MGKMRFRRCKAAILPSSEPKVPRPRGRPKKPIGESVHRKIRVSGKLMNEILANKNPNETYSDTILRIIRERSAARLEVDSLKNRVSLK